MSGRIFDVSYPIGWVLGVVGGARLMRPQRPDRSPMRGQDLLWLAFAIIVAAAIGVVASWNGGGVGGIFGWGPGG